MVVFHLEQISRAVNRYVYADSEVFRFFTCVPNLVGEERWGYRVSSEPQNASMSLSFRVVCADNFYGPDCSHYCASDCTCDPGYTGEFCHEIDDCLNVNCDGNGQCVDAKDDYTCVCKPGYTGSNCEIDINECESMDITCSNRGQCVDGINNFVCDCEVGYTGEICQTNIDDCLGVNCSGNGICLDGRGNFTCDCISGFTGEVCQTNIDDCLGVNCSGNGVCLDSIGNFTCDCISGFIGKLCQTNIDDCLGVNCSGNGVCVDDVDTFICQCETGYSGTLCGEQEGMHNITITIYSYMCTVEPLYNGHPWGTTLRRLYTRVAALQRFCYYGSLYVYSQVRSGPELVAII